MSHWEYKSLQLYEELCVLYENNRKGRYDGWIAEKKKELDEVLSRLEVKK